ncbi:hypothetical protein EAO75_01745 [Streptomyces sp. uw30]|uniref:hypothetical protein n=1 Tax=Streptomyces sp. uw30 TaxID=1828179 RepID=UPI0011CD5A44|nr:hypothetical protein [Streptomyces sp. uw30]TXS53004.1 hypothetical protein EAO75_01745 [Streptomyces sp. uw30]
MPDRSLRLLTLPPQSLQGGEHSGVLLRERPTSPPDAPSGGQNGDQQGSGGQGQDDNPFAPPPEGTPDRPWQPRRPSGDDDSQGSDQGGDNSPWGNQWSDRQPGRSPGGFGENPRGSGQDGPGGGGPGSGMRWDPTDPAQRRARYALLSGMWAFFFALFSWPYMALLLGALALYWGITSLRTKPRSPDPDTPAPQNSGRPQTTAAVSGLVTASLAIAVVAAGFAAQVVYSDYYTCRDDALTNEAQQSCNEHLPKELRGILGAES